MLARSLSAAALVSFAACDSAGDNPEPMRPPLTLAEGYTIENQVDLTASQVLPSSFAASIELLVQLREEPGEALFTLADLAGVPAVDELRAALPDVLEDRVTGWIDDRIAARWRTSPQFAEAIDLAIDTATTVIGEVRLTSELTLRDGAGTHRLLAIGMPGGGEDVTRVLDGLPGTSAPFTYRVGAGERGETEVTIAPHAFGEVPFGTVAWGGLGRAIGTRTGTDVRGMLAFAFDCPGLAADVADQCVETACVGHEQELREVCEAGLGYLVAELREQFLAADFAALALRPGVAYPANVAADAGLADEIGGWWDAAIDVGSGPRPATIPFTSKL
jgi:hypothetical protein